MIHNGRGEGGASRASPENRRWQRAVSLSGSGCGPRRVCGWKIKGDEGGGGPSLSRCRRPSVYWFAFWLQADTPQTALVFRSSALRGRRGVFLCTPSIPFPPLGTKFQCKRQRRVAVDRGTGGVSAHPPELNSSRAEGAPRHLGELGMLVYQKARVCRAPRAAVGFSSSQLPHSVDKASVGF